VGPHVGTRRNGPPGPASGHMTTRHMSRDYGRGERGGGKFATFQIAH
jgi:hypothetical protein